MKPTAVDGSASQGPMTCLFRGQCALTFKVAGLALALALAADPAMAVGRLGNLEIIGRGDGQVLPVYSGGGRNWVVGTPGQEYSIRYCNSTAGRVLAVMSVDGVNVISGDTASPAQSGYVLSAYECADIHGWRKSLAHTAAFYFTELPDAYATRTGRPENVGVIGVAIFRERPRPIAWRDRAGRIAQESRDAPSEREGAGAAAPFTEDSRKSAEAPSSRNEAAQSSADAISTRPVPAPAAKLGTGHGRSEDSPVQMVRFERESATPNETIAIHYDRRENLAAMGILPPPIVARTPNPFPTWPRFVADPPPR
jgi:hypothetical protein